jgi:hypothetical protein
MPARDQDKQLLQVPMGGSLDESSPATLLGPGKLASITNAKISASGSVQIRPGFENVSMSVYGSVVMSASDVYSHDDQILCQNGENFYTWSETIQKWVDTDFVPGCQVVKVDVGERAVYSVGTSGITVPQSSAADVIEYRNYRITAWLQENPLNASRTAWVRIEDVQSSCRVPAQRLNADFNSGNQSTAMGIRLIIGQDRYVYVCISYTDSWNSGATTQGWIEGRRLDLQNIQSGFDATVEMVPNLAFITGVASANVWEVACVGSYVVAAFRDNGGGSGIASGYVFRFDDDLTNKQIRAFTPAPSSHVCISGTVYYDQILVGYDYQAAGPNYYVYAYWVGLTSMLTSHGPTVVDSYLQPRSIERMGMAVHSSGTYARIVYSLQGVSASPGFSKQEPQLRSIDINHGGTVGDPHYTYNVTMIGMPFFRANAPLSPTMAECYVPVMLAKKLWQNYNYVVDETNTTTLVELPQTQNNSMLIKIRPYVAPDGIYYPGLQVCRLLPRITGDVSKYYRPVGVQVMESDEDYVFPVPVQSDGSIDVDVGFDVFRISFGRVGTMRPCRLGPVTLFSGGIPTQWDGDRLTEVGFNWYPRVNDNDATGIYQETNGGGQMTLLGNYEYQAVYVWQDKQGVRHYSAPSLARTVTLTGTHNCCFVEIDCLNITNRQRNPLYGTYEDAPILIELYRTIDEGTELYFVGRAENLLYSATVTIQDTASDATIQSRRQIPTSGGKYPTGCPGAMTQIVAHDGRPWGILAADPTQIAFGHYVIPGDAPRFPDGWSLRCAEGPGYTALGSFGDNLVAFQSHRIDIIVGVGPNEQGTGQNYSDPKRVCNVVGCVDSKSLIRYPEGFLFMATSGLWTIDEAFQPQYRGASIQTTLAAYPEVHAALLDDSEYRILLLLHNSNSNTGTVLAWHYPWDHWCRWNVRNSANTATDVFVGGCIGIVDYPDTQGAYLVSTTGKIVRQRPVAKDPSNTWVTYDLTTGWVSHAGLQGFGNAWNIGILGTFLEEHSLTATLYYDYDSTKTTVHTWTDTEIDNAVSGTRLELCVGSRYPESQSIQVKISITPGTGAATGDTCRLEAVTMEALNDAGLALLPAANKR